MSGNYERNANSILTELKPNALESQEAVGLRSLHYEELKKVTRSRQPSLLGDSTCLSFFPTISNSVLLCISIKHWITLFKSSMLFKTAMALTISFTPDTFYVAKKNAELQMFDVATRKQGNTPFVPRRSCDFSTILVVFFSSLGICMSTFLAVAARAFIFRSKIGFVSDACTYSSCMKLRRNS